MKIVTAGHRGSVATGDEIRGVRDNRRRIFSYSLALLFSILGAAQGAKMCTRWLASFAQNTNMQIWAAGAGCGGQYTGNISTMKATGETGGSNPADFCAARYASGESRHGIMPKLESTSSYPWSENFITNAAAGDNMCWCRITWPYRSSWRHVYRTADVSICPAFCAGFVQQLFLNI